MKIGKITTFCLVTLGVFFLGRATYSYLGGQQPSKNLGSYRSFSFYSDVAGNAATQWMQPGNAPVNPWDEFWFDPSGNFNVAGGLNVPGPVALGANSITANNLAQLTAEANFNGTVYLTAPVTLTSNLVLTCDLRPLKGAVITIPATPCASGAVVETPADTPSDMIYFKNQSDYNKLAGGDIIEVTTPYTTQYAYVIAPMGPVTVGSNTYYEIKILGYVDWYNGGAGYSYSYTTSTLNVVGPFHAGNYQCFSLSTGVIFGQNSVNTISPAWWGATGNGITDDTAAIQNAFNMAQIIGTSEWAPTNTPGTVEFASGASYKTTWTICKPISVTLQGNGAKIYYTPPSGITKQAAFISGSTNSYVPAANIWRAGGWHNFSIIGPLSGSALGTEGNPPTDDYVGIFCGSDWATTGGFAPNNNICINDLYDRVTFMGLTAGYEYGTVSNGGAGNGGFENSIRDCTFTQNYDAITSIPWNSTESLGSELQRVTSTNISNNINCGFDLVSSWDEWEMDGGSLDYNGYSVCGQPDITLVNVHEETAYVASGNGNTGSPQGSSLSASPTGVAFWNLSGTNDIVRKYGGEFALTGGYFKGLASNTVGATLLMSGVRVQANNGTNATNLTWTNGATNEYFCYDGLQYVNTTIAISDATSVLCTHN